MSRLPNKSVQNWFAGQVVPDWRDLHDRYGVYSITTKEAWKHQNISRRANEVLDEA